MTNPLRVYSLAELRQRSSMKWRRFPADVLPLWVAEMDVPLAEPVVRTLLDAVTTGDTGYPQQEPYVHAFIDFAAARWGWSIRPEQVTLVPDVMRGAMEVLKVITAPGAPVVVNCPVYPPFYSFLEHLGRRVVEAPLSSDHRIDPDALREAFRQAAADGQGAAYLLCSPHNPTGTVHTADELAVVAELAARYRVRVVVDEIHAPIVYPGVTHLPYLSLPGTAEAVALVSASKAWNLPGLKAALAVAGVGAVAELARIPEEVRYGASHLGVLAHSTAFAEGREWLDRVMAGLDENRRLLGELLAERLPGVRYRPPDGTYLAWLDCRELALPADPAEIFLERGRVALNSGPTFGRGGAGHVRLNLATSPELLTEAVHRMAAALR